MYRSDWPLGLSCLLIVLACGAVAGLYHLIHNRKDRRVPRKITSTIVLYGIPHNTVHSELFDLPDDWDDWTNERQADYIGSCEDAMRDKYTTLSSSVTLVPEATR